MFIREFVKCVTWICQSWHMWHGFVFTYFQCLWPLNLQHSAYFPSTLSTAMWVCVSVCGVWKICLEDINSGIAQKCKFFIWPPLSFCLRYTHPRHATIMLIRFLREIYSILWSSVALWAQVGLGLLSVRLLCVARPECRLPSFANLFVAKILRLGKYGAVNAISHWSAELREVFLSSVGTLRHSHKEEKKVLNPFFFAISSYYISAPLILNADFPHDDKYKLFIVHNKDFSQSV